VKLSQSIIKYLNKGLTPSYLMNNSVLEEVKEIKDLGVYPVD